ncbi:mechanosensitive ion channel [Helicobacter muridarum]|uniref:Mechanosensitive ion channel n=1 Tax=Helicobacter muridarum TaxID=216 RepID=A0A377PRI4_9HELI|nr:mechanosensitive ion channel domain-containing protein [Helicobacter muridarum]TLD97933.1 mechanosensitive ion channel [Helicobacter muridarum]STQ85446.1 Mechanosensitive ion channel membrane protein [Helicobacter muridarum]
MNFHNIVALAKIKWKIKAVLVILCISLSLGFSEEELQDSKPYAQVEIDNNAKTDIQIKQEKKLKDISFNNKEKLAKINAKIDNNESIWLKRYDNFRNYHRISNEITAIERIGLETRLTPKESHRLDTLKKQQSLLEQYRNKPFGELLDKPTINEPPTINNPFGIFSAFSYIKHISSLKENMQKSKYDLDQVITTLERKLEILQTILNQEQLTARQRNGYRESLEDVQKQILDLHSARNIFETTIDVFDKDSDEIITNLEVHIKNQILKLSYIGVGIIVSIAIAIMLKMLVKRYINHHERAYTTSKVINFFNITIIFLILLFAYIDNATYAVAMVGFASAGLAVAMKDMFMSILGWLVIVVGGSVHVGDRIRIKKENEVFIGDVLDISMLRITIYDDITLSSYRDNHRAGRMIFIPNNYIFTNLIANYTHGDLNNVWDSVEVCITFDSNITRAKNIALDVASSHAKIYTEQTKAQMRRMRDRFSFVHSVNVNPRVFNFIKDNGMEISVWFQNYAYGTLSLKSIIAQEIIEKYLQDDNIHIAYPITRIVYQQKDGLGQTHIESL